MRDKDVFILGKKILAHVKKNLAESYYDDDKTTLIIDSNFQLRLCEWAEKKYYLILYYKTNYKWEIFLKRVIQTENKITCYLPMPSNLNNQKVYEEFFGEYVLIPEEIFNKLKKQYKNLNRKKGCLLAEASTENEFFENYLQLLKLIIRTHEDSLFEGETCSIENYVPGQPSKTPSAPRKVCLSHKEYSDMHQRLQQKIVDKYTELGWNVSVEVMHRNDLSRIDVIAIKGKKKYYFEVKPYNSARECIREGLGQLLEYWYYKKSKSYPKASKLIVVGPEKCSKADTEFLSLLRECHNLPIEYEHMS